MANAARGEIDLVVGERTYILALPFKQLAALDEKVGGVLQLLGTLTTTASIPHLLAIFQHGLAGGGQTLTPAEVEALWDELGLSRVLRTCDALLAATLRRPEGETPDPQTPTPPE